MTCSNLKLSVLDPSARLAGHTSLHLWLTCGPYTAILFQRYVMVISRCYTDVTCKHRMCEKCQRLITCKLWCALCTWKYLHFFYRWKSLLTLTKSFTVLVARIGTATHSPLLLTLLIHAKMCGVEIDIIVIVLLLPLFMRSNLFLIYWFTRESPHTKSKKKCQKPIDSN